MSLSLQNALFSTPSLSNELGLKKKTKQQIMPGTTMPTGEQIAPKPKPDKTFSDMVGQKDKPKVYSQTKQEMTDNSAKIEQEFLEWAQMSWAERFFAQKLEERGLTQEEFEALPLEEQKKIADEIRQEMQEYLKNQKSSDGQHASKAAEAVAGGANITPSIEAIARKYNVESISPREVDALVKDLQATGDMPLQEIMMLSTHGEEFRSHLQDMMHEAGLSQDDAFSARAETMYTKRVNLLETAQHQRHLAQQRGENVSGWDKQINVLKTLKAAADQA